MSITAHNETARLFEMAFGADWPTRCMGERSRQELEGIAFLARNHVSDTLAQIGALGRALANADRGEVDLTTLGFLVASVAEQGNMYNELASAANGLQLATVREGFGLDPLT
ncbi:hypothetical protein N800_06690 [Lysobacter daejeonensis GH1-9]|uniref:Uncharacterized protein n=1 Tax=Lysobacter daejeonensis GH1-9 TaxID=1385517 RepID=A0A0A0EZS9_9GAMM|nr:hypothetical protein [Lysobacter daejeonensis]KGM54662.1 hypothetical protein N800_06690 [Lysobacter daejeonensis GH1-9]